MSLEQIPEDLIEQWRNHQATKLIWRKMLEDFRPLESLRTCEPESVKRYQGQLEVLDAIREFMGE